jgi:hypothetical protein
METWKPVVGFESTYHVSNFGNVKSIRWRNESQRTLTESQIDEIHSLSQSGKSARKIAPLFGVSQTVISRILRGDAYKNTYHILRPAIRSDGYLFVTLAVDNDHFHKTIHSMVSGAFIGNRPKDCQVNHIDGNKQNNVATNLEYVSRKGNMQHSLYELGNSKKLTFDQAKDIWYSKQIGEKRQVVADRHSVSIHMITAIWMGKSWWHAR